MSWLVVGPLLLLLPLLRAQANKHMHADVLLL
jgi:hypothetical protein